MRYQVIKFKKLSLEPGPCGVEELGSNDCLDELRALIPEGWIKVTFPDKNFYPQTFFPEDIVIYDKIKECIIEMYRENKFAYTLKTKDLKSVAGK